MKTAHRKSSAAKRRYQADPSSIYRLMNKLQPFTATALLRLELPIRISYESIKSGKGTEHDWSDIAAAINVAIVLSRDVDLLCEHTAGIASDALMRTWDRAQRTGRWGFDGPAISEVEAGIYLHEQFCRLHTPLQMMNAMKEVLQTRESQGMTA